MRRVLACGTVLAAVMVSAPSAHAVVSTSGSWRRWPWRNATVETLTQVGGHTYASESARKAIDVAMSYEGVYAAAPGTVVTVSTDRAAGNYVQVQGEDGTVITYEHLARLDTRVGSPVWLGDPLAVSGSSGNVTGPHLHFQRSSSTSFSSQALELAPIDGVYDPRAGEAYRSENAGIGTTSAGERDAALRAAYTRAGGYASFGVPQTLTSARTPCWTRSQAPTRWAYRCFNGLVQTYEKGTTDHVLLSKNGAAFPVTDRIHLALVGRLDGVEILSRTGFPTADAIVNTRLITQVFERARLSYEPGSCRVRIGFTDGTVRTISVC